jgi:hypothetical protein
MDSIEEWLAVYTSWSATLSGWVRNNFNTGGWQCHQQLKRLKKLLFVDIKMATTM